MELNQVKYYLAVCETFNFTKAAEKCEVSQPSLTRGIKRLEEQLGGDLFRRERARTHLTELGQMMYPVLRKCYEGALQAMRLAEDFSQGDRASIRIGMTRAVEVDRIVAAIQKLVSGIPATELTIMRDDRDAVFSALEYGDLDFAVATGCDGLWERFETLNMFEEPVAAFVSAGNRISDLNRFTLDMLEDEALLLEPFSDNDKKLLTLLHEVGVSPGRIHTMTSRCDTMSFLRADLGVAFLPAGTPCPPEVRSLPVEDLDFSCLTSVLAVSGRQHSPAGAAFAKVLRKNGSYRSPAML
ncbi:LysR family transcriptional regulator [Ruegeria atlantica]|uniref:LysR family transcriptional regulator n=1 Tax=Ruegeria atlantica TaxID=81569 RepID=UPI00147D1615|nr:LysR family transcriptional regulator [Ruegeria atlantica]